MSNTYYALHTPTGQLVDGLSSMGEAMRRLAEIEGVSADALCHEDRSSSGGEELRWDVYRAGPDYHQRQIGTVGDEAIADLQAVAGGSDDMSAALASIALATGDESAAEAAMREPPMYRLWTGGPVDRCHPWWLGRELPDGRRTKSAPSSSAAIRSIGR